MIVKIVKTNELDYINKTIYIQQAVYILVSYIYSFIVSLLRCYLI